METNACIKDLEASSYRNGIEILKDRCNKCVTPDGYVECGQICERINYSYFPKKDVRPILLLVSPDMTVPNFFLCDDIEKVEELGFMCRGSQNFV